MKNKEGRGPLIAAAAALGAIGIYYGVLMYELIRGGKNTANGVGSPPHSKKSGSKGPLKQTKRIPSKEAPRDLGE
ncbi:hypothetical protein ABB02_00939 [Clostridiaceae bacterium JG1575]|nr:hypothetical protein ABB02_00939 [Clostridiaceae bacterium JG1575]